MEVTNQVVRKQTQKAVAPAAYKAISGIAYGSINQLTSSIAPLAFSRLGRCRQRPWSRISIYLLGIMQRSRTNELTHSVFTCPVGLSV